MKAFDRLGIRIIIGFLAIALTVVGTGYVWDVRQQRRHAVEELKEKCSILSQQVLATRAFMASQQDRINRDSEGRFEFKRLNPSAVVYGVGDVFNEATRYKIKQTRLHPRNPENRPDAFEAEQLRRFASEPGMREAWAEQRIDGEPVFRYMIPLYITRSCLPCHGSPKGAVDVSGNRKEGYKVGEFAGAISIVAPADTMEANLDATIRSRLLFIGLLVVMSISLGYLMLRRLVTKPLSELSRWAQMGQGALKVRPVGSNAAGEIGVLAAEFGSMADRLAEIYATLEERVGLRTEELAAANRLLQEKQVQLQALNKELTSANHYKSEFLANMSHELRTPLTAILAFTDGLLCRNVGALSREQEEYLGDIKESGEQLLELINNLLDLSKIESGKMSLDLAETDIAAIADDARRLLRPLATKKGIRIEVSFTPAEAIIADPEKVRLVVNNLLVNAIKFGKPDSCVWIGVRPATGPESGTLLSIRDEGTGIADEDKEAIFDMFHQVDRGLSREHPGTGLGLALVKRIVDLHLGSIRLETAPGEGSTFTVFWPAVPLLDEGVA